MAFKLLALAACIQNDGGGSSTSSRKLSPRRHYPSMPKYPKGISSDQQDLGTESKAMFSVTGMTCSACAASVEKAVKRLPGIKEAVVDVLNNRAQVNFYPNFVNEQTICETIEDVGFRAALIEDEMSEKSVQVCRIIPGVMKAQVALATEEAEIDMSPVKIFKNPEGSVKEQHHRFTLKSIPKDLNRLLEDPMPEKGDRHLAQELSKLDDSMRHSSIQDDPAPDWSALPTDLLGCIANFIPLIEDFMAFRGVCKSWRAAATKDKPVFVRKVPLLMLAEKEGGSNVREFYSLSKCKICMRMPLPGATGKRCINVGFGWIMVFNGEICLLEPFSSATIKLPSDEMFSGYKKISRKPIFLPIREAVLTANPSETSNFTVLVGAFQRTGFWRNGAEMWEWISRDITMVYCNGKMHTLDFTGHVSTWDPRGTDLKEPQGKVKVDNVPTRIQLDRHNYLVGSTDGELLLIVRRNNSDCFGLMRVDLVKGECKEINGLGKDAIFLGDNCSTAVDATEFPGVLKPNCIYFTDDYLGTHFDSVFCPAGGGIDMGIYNVGDRSIERFNFNSFSRACPPLWIFPSL